jgi:hypothetical protein
MSTATTKRAMRPIEVAAVMTQEQVDEITSEGFELASVQRFTTKQGHPALRYWFRSTHNRATKSTDNTRSKRWA